MKQLLGKLGRYLYFKYGHLFTPIKLEKEEFKIEKVESCIDVDNVRLKYFKDINKEDILINRLYDDLYTIICDELKKHITISKEEMPELGITRIKASLLIAKKKLI